MAGDRIFNFNGPTVFNDIHDNQDCTINVPAPTDNTKAAAEEMCTKPRVQKKTEKPVAPSVIEPYMTFRSRGVSSSHLMLLCAKMKTENWLSEKTNEKDFLDLFAGKRNKAVVYWASDANENHKSKYGKGTLVHFFKKLVALKIIADPKPFTVENILMHHVVDYNGVLVDNLDKNDSPNAKADPEIEDFVRLLEFDPTQALRDAEEMQGEQGNEGYYDDGYNPYDHQDLQYRRRG